MSRTSLLFVLVLAGCADRALKPCDIVDPACQEDIYYVDLRVRGDGYDPFGGIPPIQTKTEDQYRQDLETAAAQAAASDPLRLSRGGTPRWPCSSSFHLRRTQRPRASMIRSPIPRLSTRGTPAL